MRAGDLVLFTDWRGDADERLTGEPGSEVGRGAGRAAERGVDVRGLVWRSHRDRLGFSARREPPPRRGDQRAPAASALLDMRVRIGGSHHQKFVVLRHRDGPSCDVAFVGGIDLCHSRRDDADHARRPAARRPMAEVYGAAPPWHDVQLAITGPAVRRRRDRLPGALGGPAAAEPQPVRRARRPLRRDDAARAPLPPQLPDPAADRAARRPAAAHLPGRRLGGYPFAPRGERSVARGYTKALEPGPRA